jgi:hypothetical protein
MKKKSFGVKVGNTKASSAFIKLVGPERWIPLALQFDGNHPLYVDWHMWAFVDVFAERGITQPKKITFSTDWHREKKRDTQTRWFFVRNYVLDKVIAQQYLVRKHVSQEDKDNTNTNQKKRERIASRRCNLLKNSANSCSEQNQQAIWTSV